MHFLMMWGLRIVPLFDRWMWQIYYYYSNSKGDAAAARMWIVFSSKVDKEGQRGRRRRRRRRVIIIISFPKTNLITYESIPVGEFPISYKMR